MENLIVNKEQRIPDVAFFRGGPDPVSTARTIVTHDEEFHTSYWGHTSHIGLTRHLVLPNYAGYANTAAASLFPDNAFVSDLAHAQGGLSGYVHPFDPPPPDPSSADPLTYSLPVDVALGKWITSRSGGSAITWPPRGSGTGSSTPASGFPRARAPMRWPTSPRSAGPSA